MASIRDDRGFSQGYELVSSTEVRMRRRSEWMIEKMDLNGEKHILELGCGTGEVSYWIAQQTGMNVLGTDLCTPFIEDASGKFVLPNLRFEVLDFNSPEQMKGRTFDYIIGNGILHHLYHHLDDALIAIRQLLRPNGRMIFLEPNIYNPYCAFIFNFARNWAHLEPDEMAFSKSFIVRKLGHAGFEHVEVKYRDFLLPGIPEVLVQPSIVAGNVLEQLPILRLLSQSLFIVAQ